MYRFSVHTFLTLKMNPEKKGWLSSVTSAIAMEGLKYQETTSPEIEKRSKALDGKNHGHDVGDCPLKCAVPCCKRTGQRLYQTTFFPCPLEPHPSSRLWARAIGVKAILKNMYICEDHFQLEDDLECYLKYKYYPRGQQRFPRFKKGVVPWKFPKCHGTSPTVHRHRVPISKTEFYQRQKARANRAGGLRLKNAEKVLATPIVNALESRNDLQKHNSKESSPGEEGDTRTSPPPEETVHSRNESEKRKSGTNKVKNTSGKGKQRGKNESNGSGGDYFNMLNGDLSTLIAHVQPAICSWDVSEVKLDSSQAVNTSAEIENNESSSLITGQTDLNNESKVQGVCETSDRASKNSLDSSYKLNRSKTSKTQQTAKFESALSNKSDDESEDEIYMTPSEDEMTGDKDTSDTDFNVSSEESWEDHEIVKPTRRSMRNKSQKNHRPNRYSPPTVLRSRAKKPSVRESPAAPQSTKPSPKSEEKTRPSGETHNSDSGVSSGSHCDVESSKTEDITTNSVDGNTSERAKSNQSLPNVSPRSPQEEGRSVSSPKKSHIGNFLEKNVNPGVLRAVSGDSSDSESIGDSRDDNPKAGESTLPEPETSGQKSQRVSRKFDSTSTANVQENPKWRLRPTKSPVMGQHLKVDFSDTVGQVLCEESQTSYSYKRLIDTSKPGNFNRKRGRQEKFLVVRDGEQDMVSSEKLSPQICGLIASMRKKCASFLHSLEEMKCYVDTYHSEKPVDACLVEPCVAGMIEELKKYPDLLELEMAHFALNCEKRNDEEVEKATINVKKIRWCNNCQKPARFHCCFSAAYCTRVCQTKDWGKHNRYCGQSRMILDDPDLRLNPFMVNRLKGLEFSNPTIGASMSNLEELHQSVRRNVNGQRIASGKNLPKTVNRSSGSCLTNNSLKKVVRPNYMMKNYPATVNSSASRTNSAPVNATIRQSPVEENSPVKIEAMDIDGSSRPKLNRLPMKSSLISVSSPNQQVRITIPPNVVAGLPSNVRSVVNPIPGTNRIGQSNTTTVNSAPKITAVAVVPKSTNGNNLVLPKPPGPVTSSAPMTLRCRTVVLPSGETQYIPVDGQTWSFKPNSQLVVKHVNQTSGTPVTVIKQATTSGSILITRPAKPAYSKFIPIAPATQTVNSTVVSPQDVEAPEAPPPLTSRLPKLTPVMPKLEPAAVRTLDSSELDKILSTDHLKAAFDMSYASNILRP